jgi:TRAP-type uncharacterized transport system substrate-binding protein
MMAEQKTVMTKKPRLMSRRDFRFVAIPSLLLIIASFWWAALNIDPAPPKSLVMSSGSAGGAYHRFALRYKDILARYGIELIIRPSGGALENLARLHDPAEDTAVAFVQGGIAVAGAADTLEALGELYYEPLWIFYRDATPRKVQLTRLAELKGKRLAIGVKGSGTQVLSNTLLTASGIDESNSQLLAKGGMELIELLRTGTVDAAIAVGHADSTLIRSLLNLSGVSLMSLQHAEAYTRHFPYLRHLTLPRGAIDLLRDIPSRDIALVAPTSNLVVRNSLHPALAGLLLQAASELHGQPGVFEKLNEFPRASQGGFPPSAEALRYFKSGKPFLQNYLPFWAATLIDRMVVLILPLVVVLFPLLRFAPALYSWRVRSRIYRRYGELKFLENELQNHPELHSREEWLSRLADIESSVNRLPTPLAFTDMLYTLRSHIELVRSALKKD